MTINLLVIGEVKFFMKKIISMCLIIPVFFSILCFFCVSKAETAPVYDATYNNNAGAFYANGTPITINTDSSNNTVPFSIVIFELLYEVPFVPPPKIVTVLGTT